MNGMNTCYPAGALIQLALMLMANQRGAYSSPQGQIKLTLLGIDVQGELGAQQKRQKGGIDKRSDRSLKQKDRRVTKLPKT